MINHSLINTVKIEFRHCYFLGIQIVSLTHVIIGLLIYYTCIAVVRKWCRNNNIPRPLAFRVGAAACLLLGIVTLVGVSVYFGRLMLINNDAVITVGCVIGIALLGGLRCRDHIPKEITEKK